MRNRLFFAAVIAAGALVVGAVATYGQASPAGTGQTYPNRPVRMITSEVGSGSDFQLRMLAPELAAVLGQPVIVENRGGGIIPSEMVAKASPDGYSLLYTGSTLWLAPFMRTVSYDPVKDFAPITLPVRAPNFLVVHPSVAANSVKELIALAKAKPGALNYASGAPGSSSHLAPELFKAMAGVSITLIPYKGTGPAVNALVAGEVQMMFASGGVAPLVKSGKIKVLAISSAEPSPLAPGIPTVAASGLPGYESGTILGILAPARTSASLIRRLNQEFVRILKRQDITEKFFGTGLETVGSTPEELGAKIKSEMARLGKVIKDVGIRAD